jgi:hypothetical protein
MKLPWIVTDWAPSKSIPSFAFSAIALPSATPPNVLPIEPPETTMPVSFCVIRLFVIDTWLPVMLMPVPMKLAIVSCSMLS